MSDKGEITQMEKFDVWFNKEWREYISDRPRAQRIALRNIAWYAWVASRQSIEVDIDWPEANDDYWKEGELGAYARGHEDGKDKTALAVRKGLADAGIKVKP